MVAGRAFGGGGGGGGILNASQSNPALTKLLQADAGRYTWAAATVNSNSAAGYQLASGEPVMAIGGFNGTDPAPTLAQFEKYVAEGKIHYFIAGGRGSAAAGSVAARRLGRRRLADHLVGRVALHGRDRRRRDRLRPRFGHFGLVGLIPDRPVSASGEGSR